MKSTLYLSRFVVSLFLCCLALTVRAQDGAAHKPFILPFADPPGASTWLLGQSYGNTVGAYLRGDAWYSAGQRLHFGLDFSTPCNTPLVAIGDGEVAFVDDMGFGSAPHNLLIRLDAGYVALYGHLLDRAPVQPGQRVSTGEVVGYSGDPDLTCTSRPHLHLELRSLDYLTTYNPVSFIDANWHMLTSIGSFAYPMFEQDLDNASRWMSIDDQPNVAFGGRPLNDYAASYPDFRAGVPPDNPPMPRELAPLDPSAGVTLRRLAFEGCCAGAWWNPLDPALLSFISGSPGQRAGIFEWNVEPHGEFKLTQTAPPPFTSADGAYTVAQVDDQQFAIHSAVDGSEVVVNTGGAFPGLNGGNTLLMYTISADSADDPVTQVWIADLDGGSATLITSLSGGWARWLDDHRLLLGEREELATLLSVVDVQERTAPVSFALGKWERLRGLSVAPGGGRLMFYLPNQPDPTVSGVYTIETESGAAAQKLDWFGAWRWRDADTVYYVPFQPDQAVQTLRYFDLRTGEDRALTDPAAQPFLIANGDWSVSADGGRIAFWNALDNLTTWLIETG